MSLQSRFLCQRLSIPSRTAVNRPRCARFSQCARRCEEATRKPQPKPETEHEHEHEKQQKDEDRSRKTTRRGLAVPALALFAVAIPLGWYLKNRNESGSSMRVSAPQEFVKYTLIGKDTVSSTCAIFKLMPSANVALDLDDPSNERAITSVQFKQPQLQIARAYTCLPQQQGQHMDELRFLIRREQKGEVSNFLHRLPTNYEIEVRGLHSEYVLPDDVKSVAFLVGGTGIAPALQAADILDGEAKMHIMWASRRREDCIGGYNDSTQSTGRWSWWSRSSPTSEADRKIADGDKGALVALLEDLKKRSIAPNEQRPRLSVDYYVDEEGTLVKPQDVKNTLGSLSHTDGTTAQGRKILIVSGPEGFVTHWAGPKQWVAGREVQGPLKGVLSTLDLNGWEVVKL